MTQLFDINAKLAENQKKNLSNAYHKRETIAIRLTKDSLSGKDTLYVPATIVKRLEKNWRLRKGMDIKLAKTNIRKQVGDSLLTSILTLGRTFAPTIAKTLGLSALAGLASEGASQIVKKISGKGVIGGFLIPQDKIDKLTTYKHLLSEKQKKGYPQCSANRWCSYKTNKITTGIRLWDDFSINRGTSSYWGKKKDNW